MDKLSYCFNADYESVLFFNKNNPRFRNAVEFLLFWVENAELITTQKFSTSYLEYVSSKTGWIPSIKTTADNAQNWWGNLENLELMKIINSKKFSYFLAKELKKLPVSSYFINSKEELLSLKIDFSSAWIVKTLEGVSGLGHYRIFSHFDLEKLDYSFPVIFEMELNRYKDLGAYYLADENRFIFYQNLVDGQFQYKGTFLGCGTIEELNLSDDERPYLNAYNDFLLKVKEKIQAQGYLGGFSVDSFFYKNTNGQVEFYPLTEINYRKTMGLLTYLLKKKFKSEWISFFIIPQKKIKLDWEKIKLMSSNKAFILSPESSYLSWHCTLGNTYESVLEAKSRWEISLTSDVDRA